VEQEIVEMYENQKQSDNECLVIDDREIFIRIYSDLRRFAAVVGDSDMDPDDLVQDALVRVISKNALSDLDNPKVYLKRTITNLCSNKRRRFGVWKGLQPRVSESSHYEDFYPSDLAVLEALMPVDRAVIYLADVEGLAHKDIAVMLDLAESTVRKKVSRARLKLREVLSVEEINFKGEK